MELYLCLLAVSDDLKYCHKRTNVFYLNRKYAVKHLDSIWPFQAEVNEFTEVGMV